MKRASDAYRHRDVAVEADFLARAAHLLRVVDVVAADDAVGSHLQVGQLWVREGEKGDSCTLPRPPR